MTTPPLPASLPTAREVAHVFMTPESRCVFGSDWGVFGDAVNEHSAECDALTAAITARDALHGAELRAKEQEWFNGIAACAKDLLAARADRDSYATLLRRLVAAAADTTGEAALVVHEARLLLEKSGGQG
jgi:hypothetical protein